MYLSVLHAGSAECGFYHYQIETKPRVSEIERRTVASSQFILATNIDMHYI